MHTSRDYAAVRVVVMVWVPLDAISLLGLGICIIFIFGICSVEIIYTHQNLGHFGTNGIIICENLPEMNVSKFLQIIMLYFDDNYDCSR